MIFLFKINFLMFFLNCFDVLISKIKKKYYFNIFSSEIYFKNQLLLQYQTLSGPEEAKSFWQF
jgi:hypothetical protein